MISNNVQSERKLQHQFSVEKQIPWLARFQPNSSFIKGPFYHFVKRGLDLFFVTLGTPFALALGLLAFILIKLESPGSPAIFTQDRTGKGGNRFKMYKFRTMVPNAEQLKHELRDQNELEWPDFKIKNDPRITKIGKILRKTSLDELPQLINIFKGEMSLVGPRPTSFSASTYELWQTERLDVIPGLTGLWQLIGRGETEFDDRLRLDIAYIERRGIMLDLQILFRTVFTVLNQRGTH